MRLRNLYVSIAENIIIMKPCMPMRLRNLYVSIAENIIIMSHACRCGRATVMFQPP